MYWAEHILKFQETEERQKGVIAIFLETVFLKKEGWAALIFLTKISDKIYKSPRLVLLFPTQLVN